MERYLMVVNCWDIEEEYAELATDMEILRHIDMQDCSNEEIKVYRVSFDRGPERLIVHGTWHDLDNPLYIKVTDESGNIVFDGWGSDH